MRADVMKGMLNKKQKKWGMEVVFTPTCRSCDDDQDSKNIFITCEALLHPKGKYGKMMGGELALLPETSILKYVRTIGLKEIF